MSKNKTVCPFCGHGKYSEVSRQKKSIWMPEKNSFCKVWDLKVECNKCENQFFTCEFIEKEKTLGWIEI